MGCWSAEMMLDWTFLLRFATARQVSACHAEAFGVGGLSVF